MSVGIGLLLVLTVLSLFLSGAVVATARAVGFLCIRLLLPNYCKGAAALLLTAIALFFVAAPFAARTDACNTPTYFHSNGLQQETMLRHEAVKTISVPSLLLTAGMNSASMRIS